MAKGLGKGLGALIPALEVDEKDQIKEIPVKDLRPNPYQPRKHFDEASIEELKQSILEHGVIQPILVRKSIKGFDIIAGERRYRAAIAAGLTTIPAVERTFDDQQMMEIALIENLQREDLNPIEIAEAYHKIAERFSLTQEDLAKKMGKSRPLVANYLRLLHLPKVIQENVSRGTISMGHAKTLVAIEDEQTQILLAEETIAKGLSVRKLEELVQQIQSKKGKQTSNSKKKQMKEPYIKNVEERLRDRLGTSVNIKPGKQKGKIEIDYFSNEDLERIIELLDR